MGQIKITVKQVQSLFFLKVVSEYDMQLQWISVALFSVFAGRSDDVWKSFTTNNQVWFTSGTPIPKSAQVWQSTKRFSLFWNFHFVFLGLWIICLCILNGIFFTKYLPKRPCWSMQNFLPLMNRFIRRDTNLSKSPSLTRSILTL